MTERKSDQKPPSLLPEMRREELTQQASLVVSILGPAYLS